MMRETVVLSFFCILRAAFDVSAETIHLKNGGALEGAVSSSDDAGLTLRLVKDGAEATVSFKRDEVDPHSWYRVRAAAVPDIGSERLALARYCLENGLFASAERELLRATSLDPSLEPTVAEMRGRLADATAASLLRLARAALDRGDVREGERLASTALARFGKTVSAGAADELLDEALNRKEELERKAKEERQRVRDAKASAALETRLDEVVKAIDAGRRSNRDGLRSHQGSGAEAMFESAARQYERALSRIAKLRGEAAGGPRDSLRRIDELQQLSTQEAVGVHLNMGSLSLVRGSYPTALEHANQALALDPQSRPANEFRARVELAAASSRRWRVGGRGSQQ